MRFSLSTTAIFQVRRYRNRARTVATLYDQVTYTFNNDTLWYNGWICPQSAVYLPKQSRGNACP